MRVITATLTALGAIIGALGIILFFRVAYVAAQQIDAICAAPTVNFILAGLLAGLLLAVLYRKGG